MHPTKFQVKWHFGSEKKAKIDFQDGSHLGFSVGIILAILDLLVTLMHPTKFQASWPFGSGEAKNRFSRLQPWWPASISNWDDFSCKSPRCFLLGLESLGQGV